MKTFALRSHVVLIRALPLSRMNSRQAQLGAAAVEYAILVAIVAGLIAGIVAQYDIADIYVSVSAKVKAVVASVTG
jgi:Flp pilus assembly protein TadG